MYGQDLEPKAFLALDVSETESNLCMKIFNEMKDDFELRDDIHSVADELSVCENGTCLTLWAYANLSYAHGSGSYPKCLTGYIEQGLKDAWEAFREANVNIYESLKADTGLEDLEYGNKEHEEILEAYYEVESESLMDNSTYFYKVQIMQDIDGIIIRAYVNVDFEYGRDYIGKWFELQGGNPDCVRNEYVKALAYEDITDENIDTVIEEILESIYV